MGGCPLRGKWAFRLIRGVRMRVSIRLALTATALLPATATAADSVQLTPGRWEETIATVSVSLDGRPLPADAFKNQRSAD